jgi:hypothetical protein
VGHHGLVMLDDDDRVAVVDEPVQQCQELVHVRQVQTGGGLVQHVGGGLLRHVDGQFEPLPLTSGQGGERLAQAEVAQAHVGEPVEDGPGRAGGEEVAGLGHRHGQDLADVLALQLVGEHLGGEPLPLALLADGGHPGHHGEVGVDQADAVAVRAGALGVRAEQGGLDPVGLGERVPDGVEQPGVGGRVAAAGPADRGLVDHDHALPTGEGAVDQRALARPGDAGDHGEHAERDVHAHVLEVVQGGAADRHLTVGWPVLFAQARPMVQVPTGQRPGLPEPGHVTGEADRSPGRTRPRAKVDHVVGDLDDLGLVLDDQDRVALVAQPEQQVVHPLDVVGVQPDRWFVEDVGDVGQAGTEVPDHLDPLGLASRQGGGLAVQAQVAQADLDQRVQGVAQGGHQWPHRCVLDAPDEAGQVTDLHGRALGDVAAVDLRGQRGGVESGAPTGTAAGERHRPVHERPDVGLHRLPFLGQVEPLHLDHEAFVGDVEGALPGLGGWFVEEVLPLGWAVVLQLDVGVHEAGVGQGLPVPRAHAEARDGDGALVEGAFGIHELGDVDLRHPPEPLAFGAHALGGVEAEGRRGADVGGAEPAEDDAQHRVGVGRRSHRGAGVGAHPFLVDDDRRAQVVQGVHVGSAQARHERLDERRIGLVDQPLRLRGDGAEHQGGLPGPGDAGEDGEPPLGDVQGDVGQVILPGPADLDHVVAVRGGSLRDVAAPVGRRLPRGRSGTHAPLFLLVSSRMA